MLASSWIGEISYQDGLNLQRKTVDAVTANGMGRVLGLEHSAVITLGRRSNPSLDIPGGLTEALTSGVSVEVVDRGGEATLHSPGQLVVYPVLPIGKWGIGVREYVGLLEETTAQCLSSYGISAHRSEREPGLYTHKGKIAFFGVRVEKGITSHGLALNVSNRLDLFGLIRSCGVSGESMDRVSDSAPGVTPAEVFLNWEKAFRAVLGAKGTFPLTPEFERINS